MLGKKSDRDVARQIGRSQGTVRHKRHTLNIPSLTPMRRWTEAENRLLGTLPDAELAGRLNRGITDLEVAQRLGCPQNIVRHKRITLGIRACHPLTSYRLWTPAENKLLGTQPDSDIGRRLNRTRASVIRRRHLLKIPVCWAHQKPWTCAEEKLLGTQSDAKIARQLNRSRPSVTHRRYRLKLPAWRSRVGLRVEG